MLSNFTDSIILRKNGSEREKMISLFELSLNSVRVVSSISVASNSKCASGLMAQLSEMVA